MTTEGVRKVMGRLMTDEKFKEEFFKDSADAVKRSGYAVDKMETNAYPSSSRKTLNLMLTKK